MDEPLRDPHDTTDATGGFILHRLEPGTYSLMFGPKWRQLSPPIITLPTIGPVKIVARERKLTTLTGKVVDRSGAPLAGVSILVDCDFDSSKPWRDFTNATVSTDASGMFTAIDIPTLGGDDDDSSVGITTVLKPGYILTSGGKTERTATGFKFTTAVMSAQNGSVAGIVLNGNHAPVPDAWIYSTGSDPSAGSGIVKSDAGGKFKFENQSVGAVEIFAAKGTYYGHLAATAAALTPGGPGVSITVLLDPGEGTPKPGDFERGAEMLQNIAAAGATSDSNETTSHRNLCAEQLAAYYPDLGVKFLKDSGAPVGSGDYLTLLQGRIALNPQAAVQWGYELVQTMMPDDQYKYRAQAQLGLAALPFAPNIAAKLYSAAMTRFSVKVLDEENIEDAMSLCGLGVGLHAAGAHGFYLKLKDFVDTTIANEKPEAGHTRSYWYMQQFAKTMAPGDLNLALHLLKAVPANAYGEQSSEVLIEMIAELATTQPSAALEILSTIDPKKADDNYNFAQALQLTLPAIYKSDPKQALADVEAVQQADVKAGAIAVVAGLTPSIAAAAPLYREAESEAEDQHGQGYTPARVAYLAYRRDKALGEELYQKALNQFNAAPRQANNDWGEPWTPEFAFYYAAIDPAYSRLLIEQQYIADQRAIGGRPWETNQDLAGVVAAMSAVDVGRASEMAYAIKDKETRFEAALRVAQYVIATQHARDTLPFDIWTDEITVDENWIPGAPLRR